MYSKKDKIALFILRLGIAFSFVYASIGGFLNIDVWIGYFPPFIRDSMSDTALITLWGVVQIVLAGWLVFSKKIFIPSLISSLFLAGLIFFNWSSRDIIFTNVTILCATVTLMIMSFKRKV